MKKILFGHQLDVRGELNQTALKYSKLVLIRDLPDCLGVNFGQFVLQSVEDGEPTEQHIKTERFMIFFRLKLKAGRQLKRKSQV